MPFLIPQETQARFVMACIDHLQRVHSDGTRPFRLLLVAYSMGGIVARNVLDRLAANSTFGEHAVDPHVCCVP